MRHKIVLSGSPCGGKTTALPRLIEYYKSKGYPVYTIPEVATFAVYNGVDLNRLYTENVFSFEKKMVAFQLSLEKNITQFITEENAIIFYDRGLLDYKAYTPPEVWHDVLTVNGLNEVFYRTGQNYDLVLHLTSVAVDYPELFTTADNKAREGCTVEIACDLDKKLLEAWAEHHNRVIIPNFTSPETKRNQIKKEIDKYLEKANETKS